MHPVDVLHYGHLTVVDSTANFPDYAWEIPGACGVWSVREIIAHLASYELLLVDILQTFISENALTPMMDSLGKLGPTEFNDFHVAARKGQTKVETWVEYEAAFQKSHALFKQIPVELHHQSGLLAWYGEEYDLEDFLTYMYYGHKREHTAQINAFLDLLNQGDSNA